MPPPSLLAVDRHRFSPTVARIDIGALRSPRPPTSGSLPSIGSCSHIAQDDGDGFDNAPDNCDASGDAVIAGGGAVNSFVCAFGGIVDRVLVLLEVFLSELLEVEGQRGGATADSVGGRRRRHAPWSSILIIVWVSNFEYRNFYPLLVHSSLIVHSSLVLSYICREMPPFLPPLSRRVFPLMDNLAGCVSMVGLTQANQDMSLDMAAKMPAVHSSLIKTWTLMLDFLPPSMIHW